MRRQGWHLIGINDDTDTCSQCGRKGLKRVYWMEYVDSEGVTTTEPTPFGSECAARKLSIQTHSKARTENALRAALVEEAMAQVTADMHDPSLVRVPVIRNKQPAGICLIPRDLLHLPLLEAIAERGKRFPVWGAWEAHGIEGAIKAYAQLRAD